MKTVLRMFWMVLWRFSILAWVVAVFWNDPNVFFGVPGVIGTSILIPLVLYYGFGIEIYTFPIKRMLNGLPWYRKINGSTSTDYRRSDTRYRRPPGRPEQQFPAQRPPFTIPRPTQQKASKEGLMTGYESGTIYNIPVPSTYAMHGVPGAGLDSATGKFGSDAVKMGQKGETNFAKILSMTNFQGKKRNIPVTESMIDELYSFWSVSVPSNGKKDYDTDVDCILIKGNKMMLVDLKYYSDGDVTYYSDGNMLYTIDNETSHWVGKPKKMSRNMEMALDRFKEAFPNYDIEAMVILIPTNMGSGKMGSYPFLPVYKGGILLYTIEDGLNKIARFFKDERYIDDYNPNDFIRLDSLLRGTNA